MKQNSPVLMPTNILAPKNIELILLGVEVLYVYPHHRIELENNQLIQTRSGPNWEGGIMTMSTCKHFMRTFKTMEPHKVALCGITNTIEGEQYLLYIGVIDKMFNSNYSLGQYIKHMDKVTYETKLATNNPVGDLFEPVNGWDPELDSEYSYESFVEPVGHCRQIENDSSGKPKWHKDINYQTKTGTRPQHLLLSPSVVYTEPLLTFTGKLGRATIALKDNPAKQLLDMLEETL